ncbi:MAG TPA: hypothetical protein DCL08_01575 [Anaerolineaceae bacterium]|nr:hypothetical protein [Anaerolineaceae bacterium]
MGEWRLKKGIRQALMGCDREKGYNRNDETIIDNRFGGANLFKKPLQPFYIFKGSKLWTRHTF